MPAKEFDISNLGTVNFYKRRGTRSIRITLVPGGDIRVTMPTWMPYKTAIDFVQSKNSWIATHKQKAIVLDNGTRVGKAHRLSFIPDNKIQSPFSRVRENEILVKYPYSKNINDVGVQKSAHRGAFRALKLEAEALLPKRLKELANKHEFEYTDVVCKKMRSRWGSCNMQKVITLNVSLMQLPWELIDYVILHELVHTKVLNHGQNFWDEFEKCLPNAKLMRKELKNYQPVF